MQGAQERIRRRGPAAPVRLRRDERGREEISPEKVSQDRVALEAEKLAGQHAGSDIHVPHGETSGVIVAMPLPGAQEQDRARGETVLAVGRAVDGRSSGHDCDLDEAVTMGRFVRSEMEVLRHGGCVARTEDFTVEHEVHRSFYLPAQCQDVMIVLEDTRLVLGVWVRRCESGRSLSASRHQYLVAAGRQETGSRTTPRQAGGGCDADSADR